MSAIPAIAIFGEGYVNLLTIAQQVFTILHCSDFQPFSFVDMTRSQGVKETPCRNKPELFDYVYASSGEGPAQPVGGAGECGGGCPVVVVVKRVEFA